MMDLENSKMEEEKISNLTKEEANTLLNNFNAMYKYVEFCLNHKREEMEELEQDEKVKKYLVLVSSEEQLRKDEQALKERMKLLEQKICNHEVVFLISKLKEPLSNCQNYKCLSCEKSIEGLLKDDQICINEDNLVENEYGYIGNISDYNYLRSKYIELSSHDLRDTQIVEGVKKYYYKVNRLVGQKNRDDK